MSIANRASSHPGSNAASPTPWHMNAQDGSTSSSKRSPNGGAPVPSPPPPPPRWRMWLLPIGVALTLVLLLHAGTNGTATKTYTYSSFVHEVSTNKVRDSDNHPERIGQREAPQRIVLHLADPHGAEQRHPVSIATRSPCPGDRDQPRHDLGGECADLAPAVRGAPRDLYLDGGQRSRKQLGGLMGIGRSKAKIYDEERPSPPASATSPDTKDQKPRSAKSWISCGIVNVTPQAGAVGPKGVLMVGPPGTGKTLSGKGRGR